MPSEHILVIFGATGDLAKRKLLPALASLWKRQLLPFGIRILGAGRSVYDDNSFRQWAANFLGQSAEAEFIRALHFVSLDTAQSSEFALVKDRLHELWEQRSQAPRNAIFYLSTPPELGARIPGYLAQHGLHSEQSGWRRLILEKPFGRDLESARTLNIELKQQWREEQLYRIDHYLGKETVQNLLVFRFANEIFDSLWNHRYVDYVEITAAESIGVENRAGYFEQTGIVRDMIQNHLLQVLALVAMDPPMSFDAQAVRYETMKIFRSLRPMTENDLERNVVFGQYTASHVRGVPLAAYRDEKGVEPHSRTETFAALKLFVDHHRWYQVPFYLRTGKRLPTRVSEVVVHFKKTPHPAFGVRSDYSGVQNRLVIRIQPDEGILFGFGLKEPGAGFGVRPVNMDFHYKDLEGSPVADSYERLLLDCMQGDGTLFALGDAVEACWKIVDPIMQFHAQKGRIFGYPAGTWGPLEADAMLDRDHRRWRYPCKNLSGDGEYCEL